MFHFPAFPPHTLCVQVWVTAHDDCRVSPFGHPRIKAWLTTPRGLSWPPTSFIGSWCQGIHRAPLKTWPQMLASTVQFSNNDQPPITPGPHPEFTGAGTEGSHTAIPSDTQQRARPDPVRRSCVPHSCEQYLQPPTRDIRPNNQRSTHEQPAPDIRRCTGL
jgi:hypothetical protein